MRRLITWNLMTLDGYFEGRKSWDLDWHTYVWGEELEQLSVEQSRSIGMLLFGRVTYEGMAAYWSSERGTIADFMNSVPKIVFSKTLAKAEWNNTTLMREPAEDAVAGLKRQDGRDLFIFGSAELCSRLSKRRLIDEYRLGLVPVVLGRGNPLFKPAPEALRMKLLEARPLQSGCVILRYEPREQ